MDKEQMKKIRDEMEVAMNTVAAKHGMGANIRSVSYGDGFLSARVEMGSSNATGVVGDRNWKRGCLMYGLQESLLGHPLKFKGVEYTIVGMTPRRSPAPVIVRSATNGKDYRLSILEVKKQLGI